MHSPLLTALFPRLVVTVAAVLVAACGPSPEELARQEAIKRLEQAAKEMEAAGKKAEAAAAKGDVGAAMGEAMKVLGGLAGAAGGGTYQPVDFRKLKEALPPELGGFEKGESSGEKNNAFGIAVSQAKQSFRTADGSKRVRLEITDPGSLTGAFALANVWLNVEIDKETDAGYERTTTVGGRRTHEKWNKQDRRGELQVVVGNRFMVEVHGVGVDMAELKALLGRVDVQRLEALKGEGRVAP
ncbi:MAG: hypothetical protein JNL19_06050 [Burkholderiales bacterium]|nr:hypothetical protein [Burkholderiales bacterium]